MAITSCNDSLNASDHLSNNCDYRERHVLSTHPVLNGVQFALGVFVLGVNLQFLVLLYRRRRYLQWKRYAFVANSALADCFGGAALIALAPFAFLPYSQQTTVQLLVLYTALAVSLSVTVESYDMLILVQYLAIRHPLWYKTLVTRRKLGAMLAWIWIVHPCYGTIKACLLMKDQERHVGRFMILEPCFLTITCLLNTAAYFYVLHVAARKKRLHTDRLTMSGMGSIRAWSSVELPKSVAGNGSDAIIPSVTASLSSSKNSTISSSRHDNTLRQPLGQEFLRQYRFLATAGMNLITYWISLMPLITVYVYMLVFGQTMYFNETPLKHIAVLLWFFRALCDPLIYVAREPKLRWCKSGRNMVHGMPMNRIRHM